MADSAGAAVPIKSDQSINSLAVFTRPEFHTTPYQFLSANGTSLARSLFNDKGFLLLSPKIRLFESHHSKKPEELTGSDKIAMVEDFGIALHVDAMISIYGSKEFDLESPTIVRYGRETVEGDTLLIMTELKRDLLADYAFDTLVSKHLPLLLIVYPYRRYNHMWWFFYFDGVKWGRKDAVDDHVFDTMFPPSHTILLNSHADLITFLNKYTVVRVPKFDFVVNDSTDPLSFDFLFTQVCHHNGQIQPNAKSLNLGIYLKGRSNYVVSCRGFALNLMISGSASRSLSGSVVIMSASSSDRLPYGAKVSILNVGLDLQRIRFKNLLSWLLSNPKSSQSTNVLVNALYHDSSSVPILPATAAEWIALGASLATGKFIGPSKILSSIGPHDVNPKFMSGKELLDLTIAVKLSLSLSDPEDSPINRFVVSANPVETYQQFLAILHKFNPQLSEDDKFSLWVWYRLRSAK